MKIAQLAPLALPVPPGGYGGTERVVAELTDELVQRGHEVTLFAAGGSGTKAQLHPVTPQPLWNQNVFDPIAYQTLLITKVMETADEFDVIHSHLEHFAWPISRYLDTPLLTTMHWRLDQPELRAVAKHYPDLPLVSISDAHRQPLADLNLNWVATIYHGLNLDVTYQLGSGEGDYLVFLGRVSEEKGTATAIQIAIRAGIPIKIAAKVALQEYMDNDYSSDYFKRSIAPLLDHPLVEWVGEQDDRGKDQLLGGARALLMPIAYEEPFGLTFIEAMACGTPVITRPRGAAPEIIKVGKTGYLAETEDELLEACFVVKGLDRATCR
ncbi:MAG: glycosyltransferase family 4 protein, partial [Candidatus Dormibacteraceae bacterium]